MRANFRMGDRVCLDTEAYGTPGSEVSMSVLGEELDEMGYQKLITNTFRKTEGYIVERSRNRDVDQRIKILGFDGYHPARYFRRALHGVGRFEVSRGSDNEDDFYEAGDMLGLQIRNPISDFEGFGYNHRLQRAEEAQARVQRMSDDHRRYLEMHRVALIGCSGLPSEAVIDGKKIKLDSEDDQSDVLVIRKLNKLNL